MFLKHALFLLLFTGFLTSGIGQDQKHAFGLEASHGKYFDNGDNRPFSKHFRLGGTYAYTLHRFFDLRVNLLASRTTRTSNPNAWYLGFYNPYVRVSLSGISELELVVKALTSKNKRHGAAVMIGSRLEAVLSQTTTFEYYNRGTESTQYALVWESVKKSISTGMAYTFRPSVSWSLEVGGRLYFNYSAVSYLNGYDRTPQFHLRALKHF